MVLNSTQAPKSYQALNSCRYIHNNGILLSFEILQTKEDYLLLEKGNLLLSKVITYLGGD